MNLKILLQKLVPGQRGLGLSREVSQSLQTLAELEGLSPRRWRSG
jgi:hypothetical protein